MSDLDTFFKQFENWVLKDIKIILKLEDENGNNIEPDREIRNYHRPFVAAVILICCAIDCLSAFRYGRKDKNVGTTFKNFIKEYFQPGITKSGKSYDDKKIYKGLRSALAHGYSLERDLALNHTDKNKHLQIYNNRVEIDVFSLYFDLEAAYLEYKRNLLAGRYTDEFNQRWLNYPLIQYIPNEKIKG